MTLTIRTAVPDSESATIEVTFDNHLAKRSVEPEEALPEIPDGGVVWGAPVFLMGNSPYTNMFGPYSYQSANPVLWLGSWNNGDGYFVGTDVYGAGGDSWGIRQTGDPEEYAYSIDYEYGMRYTGYVDGLLVTANLNGGSFLWDDTILGPYARAAVGPLSGEDANTPDSAPGVGNVSLSAPHMSAIILQYQLQWPVRALGSSPADPAMLYAGEISYDNGARFYGAVRIEPTGSPSLVGLFNAGGDIAESSIRGAAHCSDTTYHYFLMNVQASGEGYNGIVLAICTEQSWPPSSGDLYEVQIDHPDIGDFTEFFRGDDPDTHLVHIAGTDEGFLLSWRHDGEPRFTLVSRDWTTYREIDPVIDDPHATTIWAQGTGASYEEAWINMALEDGVWYLLGGSNATPLIAIGGGEDGPPPPEPGALTLAPCFTHWAQCWKIERTDGVTFGFTSHDRAIERDSVTYLPCNSLNASATELSALLGQIGNAEIGGIISDDAITDADLIAGAFDNARVEVWMVPWGDTSESEWRLMVGHIGKVGQGREGYRAEVLTPGAKLQQTALLQPYAPGCRFELGDARCAVDLDALRISGTVSLVAPADIDLASDRRIFADDGRSEADGWFARGMLTWTSGANSGLSSEIKDFVAATGQFTLWEPMPNPIEPGDTFDATPGCDKAWATCTGKFANGINFGGFKDVPLEDDVRKTPDAKLD